MLLQRLKIFEADDTTFDYFPRALSYGMEQDRPGHFVVQNDATEVELHGNTWKAFPYQHVVTKRSVLEFDFRLDIEAEGHAICLDEDLNEDVEIQGAKRCIRLGGTQKGVWSEVWNLEALEGQEYNPPAVGQFQHVKLLIGSLTVIRQTARPSSIRVPN